jgi:hypothetical protein
MTSATAAISMALSPLGLRRLRLHGAAGEEAEHQGDAFLESLATSNPLKI